VFLLLFLIAKTSGSIAAYSNAASPETEVDESHILSLPAYR